MKENPNNHKIIKPMRISKKDKIEFRKMQDRYNSKISRLQKKGVETPSKLSMKDLKNMSRRDYNILKKEVDSFTKRGSEKIVTYKGMDMPRWKKENISRAVRSVAQRNKNITQNLTREKGNTSVKQRENIFDVDEFTDIEKQIKYIQKNFKDAEIKKQNDQYKINYLEALKNNGLFGSDLYNYVKNLDSTIVFNALQDNPNFDIGYVYVASRNDEKIRMLLNDWKEYVGI